METDQEMGEQELIVFEQKRTASIGCSPPHICSIGVGTAEQGL
jgi:hypothetical protein